MSQPAAETVAAATVAPQAVPGWVPGSDTLNGVSAVASALTDPNLWRRVGIMFSGGSLIIIGIILVVVGDKETRTTVVKAAKTVGTAAAL